MAGVFAPLGWPWQKRPKVERQCLSSSILDRRVLELQTAKEILEEVFGTTPSEVEEMISLRLAERNALPENLKYL
jgi:hypothetical protein